jgi:prolipoprotein diacylglyceryltransferase
MQAIDYVVNNLLVNRYLIVSLVAFYLFAFLMARRATRSGIDSDRVWSTALWTGLGAIVLGYGFYLVINLSVLLRDPSLFIGNVGITFYGVLTGGLLGARFGAKRAGLSLRRIAILAAPFLPMAIAVDRIGCLVGPQACLGGRMDAPFGVVLAGSNVARFPSHLVEGALTLLVVVAVLLIERRKPLLELAPFVIGLSSYVVIRSAVDFTRVATNIGWLQIEIALGFFAAFLAVAYFATQAVSLRLADASSESKTKSSWRMQPHRARAPRRRRGDIAGHDQASDASKAGRSSEPEEVAPARHQK